MPEVADLHIRAVLHGAEEGGDTTGVVIVTDLCLGICSEHLGRMVLQQLKELGGDHVRDRHLFGGLVGGVAIHDSLVTGTALIHAQCNIRGLLVHQNADAKKLGQIPSQLFMTDAVKHIVNDLVVVWPVVGSDLAGNKELALFQQTLDRYTGVPVMLKNVGHDGICNLVADFIGMTIADLFTGDNFTHVHVLRLSCITKQAAFALAHKSGLLQKQPAKFQYVCHILTKSLGQECGRTHFASKSTLPLQKVIFLLIFRSFSFLVFYIFIFWGRCGR